MSLKVRMIPHLEDADPAYPSGIVKVVEKYFEYLPKFDIELVKPSATSYDVLALHAGAFDNYYANDPIVAHCHGLYWTEDYEAAGWEHGENKRVIDVIRHAKLVTVPSRWVAETFQRDMHLSPMVIPHGVDWREWQGGKDEGYILWNKNRSSDACDPTPVSELAKLMPKTHFVTTFANDQPPRNVRTVGTLQYPAMRELVKNAHIYLATTKETFGIGTLEALAAGVPVLGWDWGGTADLVLHGRNGYLAQPGDYADLVHGAKYIAKHRHRMSAAAADYATLYGWDYAAKLVADGYRHMASRQAQPAKTAVVIPAYNKAATLERAVRSAFNQTLPPDVVIIVDNNSTDGTRALISQLQSTYLGKGELLAVNCPEQGVAHARNYGIERLPLVDYICCLDADDEIAPEFLATCVEALDSDNALGIAYTGITAVREGGGRFVSEWPPKYDYEQFIVGHNQVPTCCVFRRDLWERAGGYRQRFAPGGAGAEDAEFFLRVGALGGRGERVSEEGLFIYYLGGAVSGNPHYQEPNWRAGKPWVEDARHPFASVARPANGKSHLVRQYDEPLVSIVIPCGPGHASYLVDCLDSIEAQSNRQWEVVVVGDVDPVEMLALHNLITHSYPFVTLAGTGGTPKGAGHARNVGAELARGPLLLFLDADDWLMADALNVLLAGYADNPMTIVYGDYIGHAYIEDAGELARLRAHNRLLEYNAQTTEATVLYHSEEFDCERAMRQPDARRPYIWNIVTSLVPKIFHDEVGGFDESMESWEDWDYWLRLARADHCFTRVATPVMEYRFYSGQRRALANPTESGENGRQLSAKLLEYMQGKYEGDGAMGCKSCGGSKRRNTPPAVASVQMTINEGETSRMTGSDFVTVELIDGNIGSHRIVFQRVDYGYRSSGETFLMKREHAKQDNRVRIVEEVQPEPAAKAVAIGKPKAIQVPPAARKPLPPVTEPEPFNQRPAVELDEEGDSEDDMDSEVQTFEGEIANEFRGEIITEETVIRPVVQVDFTQVWGIGPERHEELVRRGVRTLSGLIALDVAGIKKYLEVTEKTAVQILKSAEELSTK